MRKFTVALIVAVETTGGAADSITARDAANAVADNLRNRYIEGSAQYDVKARDVIITDVREIK